MGSGFHLCLSMIFSDARQIGAKNGMNGEQAFTRLAGRQFEQRLRVAGGRRCLPAATPAEMSASLL